LEGANTADVVENVKESGSKEKARE